MSQQTHDPVIVNHPEYARSYQHYQQHGSTAEDAARLAYEHTQQYVRSNSAGPVSPPKKKGKKKLVLGAAGAVAAIAIIGSAMSGGGSEGTDSQKSSATGAAPAKSSAPVKAKSAGIGTAVRDGKFEFVVQGQKCGVAKVGNQYAGATAQGQFCLVTMTVKNIGNESQMFDSSSQKAFNVAGQEYSADSSAALYANDQFQTFLNDINPGNQVKGVVVFDIPKGANLAKLELHDSPFSGGVNVALK